MNKQTILLIRICKTNKSEFYPDEMAALINLKFKEGVYRYIEELQKEGSLFKKERGTYILNENSEKVKIIKFLQRLYPASVELLLSIHTKNILQKFSIEPMLRATDLPYHNLKKVKEIAKKTKIIYTTTEGNTTFYFIRSWEEPVKRLLEFFNIFLQFDEEEFKHSIIKAYSAFTATQTHLIDEKQQELAKLNMQHYLGQKDFILDKLTNTELTETAVLDVLTKEKIKKLVNPFEITRKINEWKIRYVYNTDKIEGNTLTYEEVKTGLTKGWEGIKKEKKDILETENSKKAIENIFDTTNELNIEFIQHLHFITQQGIDPNAGTYKHEENCIIDSGGTLLDNTTPAQFVEERLQELVKWYYDNKKRIHPLILASVFHNQFLYIHPFSDGNGRVSRLLLNFILVKHGYFPVIIMNDEKQKYYIALRQSKSGDMKPFIIHLSDVYRIQLEMF
ncbi:Fic family protein [Candidatus Woesearchaeota archaeon]|nr:Fic family protein [Candidatus Woesearchaeota archaeon]